VSGTNCHLCLGPHTADELAAVSDSASKKAWFLRTGRLRYAGRTDSLSLMGPVARRRYPT